MVQLQNRFEVLSQIRDNDQDLALLDARATGADIAQTWVCTYKWEDTRSRHSQNKLPHMECPTKCLGMLVMV